MPEATATTMSLGELMAQGGVYAEMHRLQSIDDSDGQGEEL